MVVGHVTHSPSTSAAARLSDVRQ